MSEELADLRALAEYLAQGLSDHADEVEVTADEEDGDLQLQVYVAEEDMGRVIGRAGRTAKALRQVLHSAAYRQGRRCRLDIEE